MSGLAVPERKRLAELEQVIEQGLQTFIEVGLALQEIRETKLYRESHGTFAAYCEERWQFSDRRARQLMSAAQIGTTVPVPSERHARALAPLIAERGLDAAGEFLRAQPEDVTAADLERAVGEELNLEEPSTMHPQIQADAEEFGRLVRELDYEALAQYLSKLDPNDKWTKTRAALLKLEESQRQVAHHLVLAVEQIIEAAAEKSISLEQVVGVLGEEHQAWMTENGFALINYTALKTFAAGGEENEIQRVEMLAWELADNDVWVEFQPRHLVKWANEELELRAAA